jgi:ArsR family transcriptional regulator
MKSAKKAPPLAPMSDVFKQLSDQSRLAVLHALWDHPHFVSQICEQTGLSQPNVSHHLAQLKSLGLVKAEKQGQKVLYSIADSHVFSIVAECREHVEQGVKLD